MDHALVYLCAQCRWFLVILKRDGDAVSGIGGEGQVEVFASDGKWITVRPGVSDQLTDGG